MNALSEILLTHMLELLVEVSSVFSRIDQTPICKWWGNGSFIIILPMEAFLSYKNEQYASSLFRWNRSEFSWLFNQKQQWGKLRQVGFI